MTASTLHRPYYPALDGLRGVAILLVVFVHNFWFVNYFMFGWLGVDLFFVLSGFLITDILLHTLNNPSFLKNFYFRRILRIFPIYFLLLIICFLILPQLHFLHLEIDYYTSNQFWFWTYIQNWLFIFKELKGDRILLHTWSLAVEEQFYLVWPIAIILIKKPKKLLAVATVVLIATGISRYVVWHMKIEDFAYVSLYTFTRIDGLCIGCMLSLLMRINPEFLKKYTAAIVLLMAGINFGFYIINTQNANTLPYLAIAGYTTFAVLFGLLVHEVVTGDTKIINRLLDISILKFFGKISYGLYVFHWPINIVLFEYLKNKIVEILQVELTYAQALSGIIVTVIAIIVSVLSFQYIEKPFLRLKNKFK